MPPDDFAQYVAALGRGSGRSRALTCAEARDAFAQILAGDADPHQVGAFLMLLRYRGEDPEEIPGLVEQRRTFSQRSRMRRSIGPVMVPDARAVHHGSCWRHLHWPTPAFAC